MSATNISKISSTWKFYHQLPNSVINFHHQHHCCRFIDKVCKPLWVNIGHFHKLEVGYHSRSYLFGFTAVLGCDINSNDRTVCIYGMKPNLIPTLSSQVSNSISFALLFTIWWIRFSANWMPFLGPLMITSKAFKPRNILWRPLANQRASCRHQFEILPELFRNCICVPVVVWIPLTILPFLPTINPKYFSSIDSFLLSNFNRKSLSFS